MNENTVILRNQNGSSRSYRITLDKAHGHASLWQWDSNMRLVLEGFPEDIPEDIQVDFVQQNTKGQALAKNPIPKAAPCM